MNYLEFPILKARPEPKSRASMHCWLEKKIAQIVGGLLNLLRNYGGGKQADDLTN